jgi:hypothetical protein
MLRWEERWRRCDDTAIRRTVERREGYMDHEIMVRLTK